jgi:hypothetical protein
LSKNEEERDMVECLIRNKCRICDKYNCDECLNEKCMNCQADEDVRITNNSDLSQEVIKRICKMCLSYVCDPQR